ncbi:MAG: hypothetical protein ACXVZT_06895 [Terriglobales bacterium]
MGRRKSRKKAAPVKPARGRVAKFPPEADAARDEGPRLIPLPEGGLPVTPRTDASGLPTNRYVALADLALRLWGSEEAAPAGNARKSDSTFPRKTKR